MEKEEKTNWMYGAYCLVKDWDRFSTNPIKRRTDEVLRFGLTNWEWFQIYVNVIKIENYLSIDNLKTTEVLYDVNNPENIGKKWISGFDGQIPEFPMMSKICSRYFDVVFIPNQVEELRQECLKLKRKTSNSVARWGLHKLIRMCRKAKRRNLAIYFLCN